LGQDEGDQRVSGSQGGGFATAAGGDQDILAPYKR
jgi:hypothetical protein